MSVKHNLEQWIAQLDYDDTCDISDRQVANLIRNYAALEARCAALAAEMSGLDNFIKADCWVWDDKAEEYIDAVDCMPEIPATDAFLAEVRASGVEMLARETEKLGWHESTVRFVLKFAAQIRKGAQS
nr:MAG TPA: hypothetical protein [Caudoviricetes sp.]